MLSVLCRHHIGYHLWNAAWVRADAAHAFYSSRPPFAKGASERGGVRQLADSSAVLENGDMGIQMKVAEVKPRGNFAWSEITPCGKLNLRIRTTVFAKLKAKGKWMRDKRHVATGHCWPNQEGAGERSKFRNPVILAAAI